MLLTKLKLAMVVLGGMVLMAAGAGLTLVASPAVKPPSADRPLGAEGPKPQPGKASARRMLHLPKEPDRYADLELPASFKTESARGFDNTPRGNPVTDHGATLGRILFYDTRLSANNKVSCGSCHVQKHAFADPNRFSKGFEGKLTDRHAPSLANVRYVPRGRFFWDERADNLEQAVLMPIQSRIEMGQDLTRIVEILGKDERYAELFRKAFGDGTVSRERIARALAQFLRSLVSCRSKFDEALAQATSINAKFPNFTEQENYGKALFGARCATCHMANKDQAAHFSLGVSVNNGLDADHKNTDGGVGDISLSPRDLGRFKSPSLRNVEVTGAYMHDGRFDTLEKVIDHYAKGIKDHPNLDPRLFPVGRERLNFTDFEKAALVAFLKTLTDERFLTDPKFSDPWR
jgi:cytochrome c peroxidase